VKRSRRRARPASDLGVAADVATDTSAESGRPRRGNRYSRMKLPHERDESAHALQPPKPVMAQAALDIEQGKTDTDCYNATGPRYDRKVQP